MYKLFIADDEPKIRKGLSKLINSFELDVDICGEAEDGQTAIDKANALQPDILLVDICMPIKSGLEFIEECQEKLQYAQIIIISGHDEFEYAKKALEMKVDGYLLKPVSKTELKSILVNSINELDCVKEQKQLYNWALSQLNKRKEFLVECFLRDWVQGRLTREEINEQMKFLEISIPSNPGLLVCRVGDEQTNILSEKDYQLRSYAIISVIKKYFEHAYVFRDNMANIVVLYQISDKDQNTVAMIIKEQIQDTIRISAKLKAKQVNGCINTCYVEILEEIRTIVNTPIVDAAKRYIECNYNDESINLSVLASKFNVSTTYITRLLKQETGLTFVEYLTQIRIKNAIMLMQNSEMSLLDISGSVGFKSQHYFSTVFKKVFGVAPTEYRQNILRINV